MTEAKQTLGEVAQRYLVEPMDRMQKETGYDALSVITPPPNPEGAAVIVTTTTAENVEHVLRQAIVSYLRSYGRKVRVIVEDV